MSDRLSGRQKGSAGSTHPFGPKPLRLGKRGEGVALEAREAIPGLRAVVSLPSLPGEPSVSLSKHGAGVLGRWLLDWARPKAKLELWSAAGIAKECSVSRGTVHNWRRARGFPAPIEVVGGAPVWEASVVKAWVRLERPKPGRPGKQKARRS
jgi:predicted DNA-binding transcriptional regulator AlpA